MYFDVDSHSLSTFIPAMNVSIGKRFTQFQRYAKYLPFKGYLLIFLVAIILGNLWLRSHYTSEPSVFNDVMTLTLSLVKWVLVPFLSIGFLSVFVPFILFWIANSRRKLMVTLQSPKEQPEGRHQPLEFFIEPLWQPVLGQLYYRLIYHQGTESSPKFSLVRKENAIGYAGRTQNGWYRWPLPGIKEYEVDTMIVYFEDIFHFFSLAIPVTVHQSFFTRPGKYIREEAAVSPTRTEKDEIKVDDWRRVQGELFHYKFFENNDDVRRIVWKIYARNKDLVVRTPEIMDPYASHIGMYLSFYTRPGFGEIDSLMDTCLDFYKTACWTLYDQLTKQDLQIRFMKDQEVPQRAVDPGRKLVEYTIAVSHWQRETSLQQLVKPNETSLVCISSFSAPEDLAYLLANGTHNMTLALVPLSRAIPLPKGIKWLRWLWVEEEKDPVNRQQIKWLLSADRKKMMMNEEKLQTMIDQSGVKQINFATAFSS